MVGWWEALNWGHWATVLVLTLAVAAEVLGAYCAQKELLGRQRTPELDLSQKRWWWARLWLKRNPRYDPKGVTPLPQNVLREQVLTQELGNLSRGMGRLAVVTLFLVRFAVGLPPPWLG